MSKKVNSLFMAMIFAALMAFLAAGSAEAFCVYNHTDVCIQVDQTSGHKAGRGFSMELKPTDNSCCNWKDETCNKEGKRDSILKFDVEWYKTPMRGYFKNTGTICDNFPIQAGGWLTVEGSNGNYRCVRHDY